MQDDIIKMIDDFLKTYEGRQTSHVVGASDYDRGYANGLIDGQGIIVAGIRSLLQLGENKPLAIHDRVKVINGMWMNREGTIEAMGMDTTGTKMMAEVLLDGLDLPVQIVAQHLKSI